MRSIILYIILTTSLLGSCQTFKILKKRVNKEVASVSKVSLSEDEVANGLKEALVKGCQSAVKIGGATDGFYRNASLFIPFPEEAVKVKEYANKVGLNKQVDDFEESMNRAAEKSVSVATSVLVDAVVNMSIADAWGILKGDEDAATKYLRRTTSDKLYDKFLPITKKSIEEVEVTKYWSPLANAYNKTTILTREEKVNPDLEKYITDKALDGVYLLIAKEEKLIRKDPLARTTDLLRKVFAEQ